jgi:hypothetical protein
VVLVQPVDEYVIHEITISKAITPIKTYGDLYWYVSQANKKSMVNVYVVPSDDFYASNSIILLEMISNAGISGPVLLCSGYSIERYRWLNIEKWEKEALKIAELYPKLTKF